MLDIRVQRAELVRILHRRGHLFATDPAQIDQVLRHDAAPFPERLFKRAALIDSDEQLLQRVQRSRQQWRLLLLAASVLLLVGGFSASSTLMAADTVNFFHLLLALLGLNSLMLLLWLASLLPGRRHRLPAWLDPALWLRRQDELTQAQASLYAQYATSPALRWYAGMCSHRLWLCTLLGVWVGVWLMLLVRQYSFNWESTLLASDSLVQWVAWLSWLPSRLGFAVPDAEAVRHSRLAADSATARQWGSLLVGSVLCYGLLPRLAAWLWCFRRWRRCAGQLPLSEPYYQHIVQQWQQRVVDADEGGEPAAPQAPPLRLSDDPKWALLLEADWPDPHWHRAVLGQVWQNRGVLAGRADYSECLARLSREPAQLLLGVRAHRVPDRGLLRQIDALAGAASSGVVVLLLLPEEVLDDSTLQQWRHALAERQLTWLDPPVWAQRQRSQREAG